MSWANRYVGLSYADDGITGGYHCWSLVRLVLAEQCGVDVPTYGDISATNLIAAARAVSRDHVLDPWLLVDEPQPFDVVVMLARVKFDGGGSRRVPSHVGIMVDRERLLHIEAGLDAVMVSLNHPSIRFRLHQLIRHRALTDDVAAFA